MGFSSEAQKLRFDRELYEAIEKGDEVKVIELCRKVPEGPLYPVTIHKDTVIHMATYSKQEGLVASLLKELPETHWGRQMATQNDIGNTMLHEAATTNKAISAAEEMLRLAPELLETRNQRGETAIFRAARYGKMNIFQFLEGKVNKLFEREISEEEEEEELQEERRKAFYVRDDKTTILQICILSEQFELAWYIARGYEYLICNKDDNGMTALQLLAYNPSAFEYGSKLRFLERIFSSCFSDEVPAATSEGKSCFRVPLWESIKGQRQRYKSAVELANLLIEKDTSWKNTESAIDQSKPRTHKFRSASLPLQEQGVAQGQTVPTTQISNPDVAETPLFLAAKSGILEIVKQILKRFPQAIEHIDDEGRNILHVAIKYRQMDVFDFVEEMEFPMKRLVRKIENQGNSILHMVGIKGEHAQMNQDMRSPAITLREDLLLFERVKKTCATHLTKHLNNEEYTAEQLFAKTNAGLSKDAKEWLKRTAENCSIVAVLIATVAFAAAYTVPGGPNQNTGYPLLLNQSFFAMFTITDVLSLTFALTSVITFLSILTSPFQLNDFKRSLPDKLMLGVTLLILSVSMMMLSFAATVILLIQNKQQWTRIALYAVASLPVSIFALSYIPLYFELMKSFLYTIKKIGDVFPRFNWGYKDPVESQASTSTRGSTTQTTFSTV
ncbi:uncharacterized protein LOC127795599 [Diospyros lotus]|uniref:uncharacterized protein LOC127795599 n=1 Tax=Diospyros lotus TaxID=55363 RepID=UPI0022548E7B|nr:uncharacterized protein LOC127795599 [Diospyros lotus]